jgi:ABC-type multidrug transport system ATPase subunit
LNQYVKADFLGDRIAIMSKGALKCCGSPLYLKSTYGSGYNLILNRKRPASDENSLSAAATALDSYAEFEKRTQSIIDTVQSIIPDSKLNSNINTEISFILPSVHAKKFPQLLEELEKCKESLSIVNIGVSVTTVEDVFLR